MKTLGEVNKLFKYQSDKSLDSWTGLQYDGVNLVGDCEDYCITLKREVGFFKDWGYYYCKLNGVGHCILVEDNYTIDCNSKKILPLEEYIRKFEATDIKKYNWFVVFSKLLVGKLKLLFK